MASGRHATQSQLWVSPEGQVTVGADADVGVLGEAIAIQYLLPQGWRLLHHRWRCTWGELDVIVESPTELAFVEVKVRSRGNWDADGLLAVTPAKQAKLWRAAECFLAESPLLAQRPCRFDVALIRQGRSPQRPLRPHAPQPLQCQVAAPGSDPVAEPMLSVPPVSRLGQPVTVGTYRLTLDRYIDHAFDA